MSQPKVLSHSVFFSFISALSLEENMQNAIYILQTFNLMDLTFSGDGLHPF